MAKRKVYLTKHQWGQIIAEAWLDEDFKEALEENPEAAIKKRFGFRFDRLLKVPPRPANLTDEQLDELRQTDDAAFMCQTTVPGPAPACHVNINACHVQVPAAQATVPPACHTVAPAAAPACHVVAPACHIQAQAPACHAASAPACHAPSAFQAQAPACHAETPPGEASTEED